MKIDKSIWFTAGFTVVIFLSGAVTGFFARPMMKPDHFRRHPGPPPSPEKIKSMIQDKIFSRLKLSQEQENAVKPAIQEWFLKMETLRKEEAPRYTAVFDALFDKIEPILNKDQVEELKVLREETKARHNNRKNPPKPEEMDDEKRD